MPQQWLRSSVKAQTHMAEKRCVFPRWHCARLSMPPLRHCTPLESIVSGWDSHDTLPVRFSVIAAFESEWQFPCARVAPQWSSSCCHRTPMHQLGVCHLSAISLADPIILFQTICKTSRSTLRKLMPSCHPSICWCSLFFLLHRPSRCCIATVHLPATRACVKESSLTIKEIATQPSLMLH